MKYLSLIIIVPLFVAGCAASGSNKKWVRAADNNNMVKNDIAYCEYTADMAANESYMQDRSFTFNMIYIHYRKNNLFERCMQSKGYIESDQSDIALQQDSATDRSNVGPAVMTEPSPFSANTGESVINQENAYGPNMHMDQYGRPVSIAPAYPNQGGYYGDSVIKQPNAYGPGMHMDQYGRPVQVVPRY